MMFFRGLSTLFIAYDYESDLIKLNRFLLFAGSIKGPQDEETLIMTHGRVA